MKTEEKNKGGKSRAFPPVSLLFLFSSRDSNINISTEEGGLPNTRKWNLLWPFCRIEGKERGAAGGGTRELFEGAE